MKENVIEVSHLHKAFGKVKAVRDLSFRVKGENCLHFLV